jgi:hypothetical protein
MTWNTYSCLIEICCTKIMLPVNTFLFIFDFPQLHDIYKFSCNHLTLMRGAIIHFIPRSPFIVIEKKTHSVIPLFYTFEVQKMRVNALSFHFFFFKILTELSLSQSLEMTWYMMCKNVSMFIVSNVNFLK